VQKRNLLYRRGDETSSTRGESAKEERNLLYRREDETFAIHIYSRGGQTTTTKDGTNLHYWE
jgi:hypothetical protein